MSLWRTHLNYGFDNGLRRGFSRFSRQANKKCTHFNDCDNFQYVYRAFKVSKKFCSRQFLTF